MFTYFYNVLLSKITIITNIYIYIYIDIYIYIYIYIYIKKNNKIHMKYIKVFRYFNITKYY